MAKKKTRKKTETIDENIPLQGPELTTPLVSEPTTVIDVTIPTESEPIESEKPIMIKVLINNMYVKEGHFKKGDVFTLTKTKLEDLDAKDYKIIK